MLTPIRVLIVDDHPLVRMTLALGLQHVADFEVVGEATDGDEAVELAARLRPDVVVMDYNMPRMNGDEATRRIKAALADCRVIGLSIRGTEVCGEMMRAGATMCIAKGVEMGVIVEAVRMAADAPSTEPP